MQNIRPERPLRPELRVLVQKKTFQEQGSAQQYCVRYSYVASFVFCAGGEGKQLKGAKARVRRVLLDGFVPRSMY